MKKIYWLFVVLAFVMSACNSGKVKIRGEVKGLNGTVKLMAEMPGQQGIVVVTEQEVKDGKINLVTDQLGIPARVWVDIAGLVTVSTIVDSKDQIWIQGKAKYPDQIEVKGSGLDKLYAEQKKYFKEKFEGPLEPIDKNIQKLLGKTNRSTNDEVMLGVFQLQRQKYIRARANHAKHLIEANPTQELSLFLLQDELQDSTELQKRLFKIIDVPNKESNVYKTIAEKLQ